MATKNIPFDQLPFEVEKIYSQVIKEAEKTRMSSTRKAGQFNLRLKRRLAPEQSGHLRDNITGHKSGKDYIVKSVVYEAYPYNFWVDNRIKGGRRSIPYNYVQKTGISGGGFFTIADKETEKKFLNIVVKDISTWETVK